MEDKPIRFIQNESIKNKTVLLRVDFNVSLNPNNLTIADDARIRQSIPTIKYLLQNNNKLIIVSHLGRPKEPRDPKYSMKIVCNQLHEYLPEYPIRLINDFLTEDVNTFNNQQLNEIYVLENTRYYSGEKENDEEFAKKLASLAEVYVNDAFGVSHRSAASVVGITKFLPSYGGLLLNKEIDMISKVMTNAKHPVISIIGGAKIDSKIHIIEKLIEISDTIIIGGGLANTFLAAQEFDVGNSFVQIEKKDTALQLIDKAKKNGVELVLPADCIVGNPQELEKGGKVYKTKEIPSEEQILDIGPETLARIGSVIAKAKTIIWNGPVGYFENPHYRHGTDFVYYAITNNTEATSVVGGGDTLAAISKKEYLDKITHISTGGGAMLEFIEKGTLPGIEALKQ